MGTLKIESFRREKVSTILLLCFLFVPYPQIFDVAAENPEPFFYISVLAPNTSPVRPQFGTLMVEQLPKIGIGVEVFDHTGWAQISPRTWGYPGPYPIPTYAEGGFDILFVGWSWGFDWDPTGLFDTPAITPNGDNFYQYSNPEMDAAITSYTSSYNLSDRIKYVGEIQSILYEDLPQISIIYPADCYPHDANLDGFEAVLWTGSYCPFNSISIPNQTVFNYATPADFVDFTPHHYESVYDAQWLHQIYNGVVERDSSLNNAFGPWLAESISSSDGLTYYVKIKDDACWADGTDLTTDDVIYNYNLTVTQTYDCSNYAYYCQYWNNDSITKINDKEYTITFNQFYCFNDAHLSLDLIPEHIWGDVPISEHQATAINWSKDNPEKIFGAGPYMLQNYDYSTGVIILAKNPHFVDWYGIEPYFDSLCFRFYGSKEGALSALANGALDMVDSQFSPRLDEINVLGSSVSYTLCDDPGTQEMAINMLHPIIGTGEQCPIVGAESAKHIRKAISHMVPRDIIVAEILDGIGKPGVTACPTVAIGYNTSLRHYSYDIEMAKYHMAQAGYDINYSLPPTGSFLVALSFSFIVIIFGLLGAGIWITRRKA